MARLVVCLPLPQLAEALLIRCYRREVENWRFGAIWLLHVDIELWGIWMVNVHGDLESRM